MSAFTKLLESRQSIESVRVGGDKDHLVPNLFHGQSLQNGSAVRTECSRLHPGWSEITKPTPKHFEGDHFLLDIARSIRKNNLYSFVTEALLLSKATRHQRTPDAVRIQGRSRGGSPLALSQGSTFHFRQVHLSLTVAQMGLLRHQG